MELTRPDPQPASIQELGMIIAHAAGGRNWFGHEGARARARDRKAAAAARRRRKAISEASRRRNR